MTTPQKPEHTPRFSWQFDPLDANQRVQITDSGVVFAEVQTLNAAELLVAILNQHAALLSVAKQAKTERDRMHYAEYCKAVSFMEYMMDKEAMHTKAKEHAAQYVAEIDHALSNLAAIQGTK